MAVIVRLIGRCLSSSSSGRPLFTALPQTSNNGVWDTSTALCYASVAFGAAGVLTSYQLTSGWDVQTSDGAMQQPCTTDRHYYSPVVHFLDRCLSYISASADTAMPAAAAASSSPDHHEAGSEPLVGPWEKTEEMELVIHKR